MLISSTEIAGAAHAADTITSPAPAEAQAQSPAVLITTQQVLFGSAVALGTRRGARLRFVAVVRRMWAAPAAGSRPRRASSYPRRYGFLEQSLMAREMGRL